MNRYLSRLEVEELLMLGFLKYALQEYTDEDLALDAAEFIPGDWHGCGRVYYLDAEYLAEGGAADALSEMGTTLAAIGVEIGDPHVSYDERLDVTTLDVNGQAKVLCKWPIPEQSSWEAFSNGFFSIINELLANAGSPERLYTCRPYANDQSGVLLTPQLFEKFSELGLASDLVLLGEARSFRLEGQLRQSGSDLPCLAEGSPRMEESITLNLPYDLSETDWSKVADIFRTMEGWNEEQSCWFVGPDSEMYICTSAEPSGLLVTGRVDPLLFRGWVTKLCARLTLALGREVYDAEV